MSDKRDLKNIFKHYKGKSEHELKGELSNIKRHTKEMKKIGIHTTPAHEQSIKYHLSSKAKHKALEKSKNPTEYKSKWRKSNKWRKLPEGDTGERMKKYGYQLR